jgi:hypothetical protein
MAMATNRFMYLSVCFCVLFLSSCGVTTAQSTPAGQGTPNASAGTSTSGPVAIATDHATYAPTDVIQVTLMNHLTAAIYAYDHQASCSIFGLEMLVGGQWQDASQTQKPIAGCPLGSVTRAIAVPSGGTYQAGIRAGYLRQGDERFLDGKYRLRLSYATTPLTGIPPSAEGSVFTTIYSALLTVDSSLRPEPTATLPPSGSGSGTAVAGTAIPVGTTSP